MSSVRGSRSPATDDLPARTSLASWYAQGPSDGFGDRLLMFDNAATGPLELLRVRPDFAFIPEFEAQLRRRHEQLGAFAHPNFAIARSVNHLDNDEGLTVVSAHIPGTRLSDLFRSSRPHAGMHPASVRWALGELVPALAELHREHPDIAHGALAPERIVITADRHLVITDYLFGSALASVGLPPDRLWSEFAVVATPSREAPRLDQRADVVQLALTMMALVLARRISPAEYPAQLPDLLDQFSAACDRRAPDVTPVLRGWLQQALAPDGFQSGVEAELALVLPPTLPVTRDSRPTDREPAGALDGPNLDARRLETSTAVPALAPRAVEPTTPAPTAARSPLVWIAAAMAVVAVVEAGALARVSTRTSAAAPPATVTLESGSAGDTVVVDGKQAGVTPLQLAVSSSTRSVRIVPQTPVVQAGAVLAVSEAVPAAPSTDKAVDASRPPNGGLRIESPIPVQVVEGDRVLGSSAGGPVFASPGTHELDLINSQLGFKAHQTVRFVSGRIASLTVTPPNGTISINAQPWAQVWIDGKSIGDTPLGNVAVPLGEHEIVFRHPQLGERRQKAVVQAGTMTRVSVTFTP